MHVKRLTPPAVLLPAVVPLVLIMMLILPLAYAVESPPLEQTIRTAVEAVKTRGPIELPLITWGGDIATILANGNALKTASGSIFAQKGLDFKLVREDDFANQVKRYVRGDTPYLRGTMGMLNMAADVLSRDPRLKPVIVYQLTWSNGGDCLVVKSGIKRASDLKGKTIALQAYGPHVDYLSKILKDAGLTMRDVNIRWARDLTGTDNTPVEAMYDGKVDAAFMIIPDGLMLTSNGTVGTGAEGSIKGARILLSTKTANRIISDVYAVRSDYFQAHTEEVQSLVHGLLLAQQELKALFKHKEARTGEYGALMKASAAILLDSPQATGDAEALYGDCEFAGFRGNVKFFGDHKWPRSLPRLTDEIQTAFITVGLLKKKTASVHARWNYDELRSGLTGVDDIESPRFKKEAVAKVVARKQAMGTLDEGELFSFEINFQPNQRTFSADLYAAEFEKVVDLSATYGGAVITIEGHSDPHKYNKLKKKGAAQVVLRRTKQAAKNLSMNRALSVRKSVMDYAARKNIPLDDSQFTVVGHGISHPKFGNPKTKEEWLGNMRVAFRIIQIEAEDTVFEPLE